MHLVDERDDIVAQLSIWRCRVLGGFREPGDKAFSPRQTNETTSRTLLVVDNPEEVVARAVAAGATESSSVGDMHSWRLGRIIDPFGHKSEVGKPLGPRPRT
jgi:PhnB protein